MSECLFCKIANGEMATEFVYEDDLAVAFRDINPKKETHILIVPKVHIDSIKDMKHSQEALIGHLIWIARQLGEKFGLKGYNLQVNVGKEGGQEIFHIHVHLMSKFSS